MLKENQPDIIETDARIYKAFGPSSSSIDVSTMKLMRIMKKLNFFWPSDDNTIAKRANALTKKKYYIGFLMKLSSLVL